MSTKWGKINFANDIQQTIIDHLAKKHPGKPKFSFDHIRSGFTDNVFQITVSFPDKSNEIFIAKEYLEAWHQKEKGIYEKILQQNPALGAPQLIASGKEFIILEYLNTKRCRPLSTSDINLLQDWLIAKHIFFRQHPKLTIPFGEDEQIQIHYLVEKPLGLLAKLDDPKLIHLTSNLLCMKNYFIDIVKLTNDLPPTLEHGDLEPQNLFIEDNKRLRVIDWVNARKGSGLFDINQFFETAKDLGVELNIDKKTKEIACAIGQEDLSDILPKIRAIMLLNKIHFYGDKYLNGELFSHSRLQTTYSMLKEYLEELNSLVKNQKPHHSNRSVTSK